MDENQKENDVRILTINDIAGITGGNYRTVRNIIQEMQKNKELASELIIKNGRSVVGYVTNKTAIKNIQADLQEIRKGKTSVVKQTHNTNAKSNNDNTLQGINENNQNVTIYEVTKRNNDLENEVHRLQMECKDWEIKYTRTDSELKQAQNEVKLLTVNKELEKNANAELKAENTQLKEQHKEEIKTLQDDFKSQLEIKEKQNKKLMQTLYILGFCIVSILLVISTIACTYYFLR